MKRVHSLMVFLLGVIWIPACGQDTFEEKMASLYKNTVPLVRAEELTALSTGDIYLLDTRAPAEYQVSHLRGARLIDYDKFEASDVTDIPKDAVVVVYCSVGYRSERIGEKMQELGFQNVKNLYGGIFDWKNKGYEVYNSRETPTDSIHTYNESWSRWLYNGIKVYE